MAQKDHGEELADAGRRQHPGRLGQPPRRRRHQREGEDVLHRHEAEIEPAVEPRPGEGGVVVEHADAERRQPGAAQNRLAPVRAAGEAEGPAEGRGGQEQQADAQVGPVEPVADPRLVDPHASRVEPCRREAQPLEQHRVQHDGAGGREGEPAEIGGPQQLGDQQAEDEVEPRIEDEGGDHGHGRRLMSCGISRRGPRAVAREP